MSGQSHRSGNPARIVGYADTKSVARPMESRRPSRPAPVQATSVRGVTVHRLTLAEDLRGRLAAGEFGPEIPFAPKRYFMVFDVPGKEVRGEHAHRQCQQFLVCVRGSVSIVVDDGRASEEIELSEPKRRSVGTPAMVWAVQYKYSADAVLLVFASEHYDAGDYIRDYEEFRPAHANLDKRPRESFRDGFPRSPAATARPNDSRGAYNVSGSKLLPTDRTT
jgi:dTDP-4-dehydrorhamnose 3,5-epimerase-like enzyme